MSVQRADEMLDFIRSYIQTENMAPSVREICEGVGIRSTSTAHRYLHRLENEGKIRMSAGKNRAIVVTDGKSAVRQGIPLIGAAPEGIPLIAEENVIDHVSFDLPGHHDNALFAVRIRGRAMSGRGMADGDIVIAEQIAAAENGDAVVLHGEQGELIVRTLYSEDGKFRLQPEGDGAEPVITEDPDILGRAVALIRYF